jgi:hypothetical protein
MKKVRECKECVEFYEGWCRGNRQWCYIAKNHCGSKPKKQPKKPKHYLYQGNTYKLRLDLQNECRLSDYKWYKLLKLGIIKKII